MSYRRGRDRNVYFGMVLHSSVSGYTFHPLRIAGLVGAYALALVTGTAILIAAIGSLDNADPTAVGPGKITAAELVMQQTAELGVEPFKAMLLAASNQANDKRGY